MGFSYFEEPAKKCKNGWLRSQIHDVAKVLKPDIEAALEKSDSPFELASEIQDLLRHGKQRTARVSHAGGRWLNSLG